MRIQTIAMNRYFSTFFGLKAKYFPSGIMIAEYLGYNSFSRFSGTFSGAGFEGAGHDNPLMNELDRVMEMNNRSSILELPWIKRNFHGEDTNFRFHISDFTFRI